MNTKELRIGNFISNGGGIVHVTELDEHGASVVDGEDYASEVYMLINDFSPIPLTPEWLERFGFVHAEGSDVLEKYKLSDFSEIWHSQNGHFIEWESEDFKFYIHTDEDVYFEVKWVEHVHQLQNLYFALTGTELTIKEPATK